MSLLYNTIISSPPSKSDPSSPFALRSSPMSTSFSPSHSPSNVTLLSTSFFSFSPPTSNLTLPRHVNLFSFPLPWPSPFLFPPLPIFSPPPSILDLFFHTPPSLPSMQDPGDHHHSVQCSGRNPGVDYPLCLPLPLLQVLCLIRKDEHGKFHMNS